MKYLMQLVQGATFFGLVLLVPMFIFALVNGIWSAVFLSIPCAMTGIVILVLIKEVI
jgi:hypothetical protein